MSAPPPMPPRPRKSSGERTMSETPVAAEAVLAGYAPDVDITRGCSMVIEAGRYVRVICPNAVGKSTLLKSLFGRPSAFRSPPAQRAGRDRAAGRRARGPWRRSPAAGAQRVPEPHGGREPPTAAPPAAQALARTRRLRQPIFPILASPGRHRGAGLLSGGERQMVVMGCALVVTQPRLLCSTSRRGSLARQPGRDSERTVQSQPERHPDRHPRAGCLPVPGDRPPPLRAESRGRGTSCGTSCRGGAVRGHLDDRTLTLVGTLCRRK